MSTKQVCIVGASGKLGTYMIRHALERGYTVRGVCRPESAPKLAQFAGRITLFTGQTNDEAVIREAVAGCDAVLTVLVPWGRKSYSTGTAQAVLTRAPAAARLVFSSGWHISKDGQDRHSPFLKAELGIARFLGRLTGAFDIDDQEEACRRIFASKTRWTLVRGSDLKEGPSEGLPIWARHSHDPALRSNIVCRTDFALFMVAALENDSLIGEAPAIVSRACPSALAAANSLQHA